MRQATRARCSGGRDPRCKEAGALALHVQAAAMLSAVLLKLPDLWSELAQDH